MKIRYNLLLICLAGSLVSFCHKNLEADTKSPYSPDNQTTLLLHMDEKTREGIIDTVNDSSAHRHKSSVKGKLTSEGGKIAGALKFNGIDTFIEIDGNNSLDMGRGDITIEMWVKRLGGYGSVQRLYSRRAESWYDLFFNIDNTVTASINSPYADTYTQFHSNRTITDSNWHHVAVVFDRDRYGEIYIDGKADGAVNISKHAGDLSIAAPVTIGAWGRKADAVQFFDGLIDEVRVSRTIRAFSSAPAVKREMQVPRTIVISRTQAHYSLFYDYHGWDDRMLLADRSTGPLVMYGTHEINRIFTYESFSRIIKSAKDYEIDGFGISISGSLAEKYIQSLKFIEQSGVERFYMALDFFFAPNDEIRPAIKAALASKSALKMNGKLVIVSYLAWTTPDEKWKGLFDGLRTEFGDCFIFLHDGGYTALPALIKEYAATGQVSESTLENSMEKMRRVLDVYDGIYFNAMSTSPMGKNKRFDREFNRDIFVPLFTRVLSEEKYKHKYFGLSASEAHHNSGLGLLSIDENGTKQLRYSMEVSMGADPDIIVIPEWDEFNENTNLCPTVCNSYANQRIMKYYMRVLKKEKQAPNPGDNVAIPNAVISYRKFLTFGEPLEIEVLNIPDSDKKESYSVQVSLKDIGGKIVKRFDQKKLSTNKMYDETFVLGTEELAQYHVLVPSVAMVNPKGRKFVYEDGLMPIQLRTWNWDSKWVKQPLRDIIAPKSASFDAAGKAVNDDGSVTVNGSFECAEDIASAKVLEDDDEVYSYDINNEFKVSPENLQLKVTLTRTGGSLNLSGKITVKNSDFYIFPKAVSGVYSYSEGNSIEYAGPVEHYKRKLLLTIPKANAEKAVLDFNFNEFRTEIPVNRITKNGIYSEAYKDGLTLTVEHFTKLYRIPLHVNQKKVAFTTEVFPDRDNAPFHMRVITRSGKIYRTKPKIFKISNNKQEVNLPVWSDIKNEVVNCTVPAYSVPDIVYGFTPEYGTILHAGAGRAFWGQMGGFWDVSSGRDHFAPYGDPFQTWTYQYYPKNITDKAPAWVKEDGFQCLKFNGAGNFIALPPEVIPKRGAYTLSFEIKPTSDKPQIIFSHRGQTFGSIILKTEKGKLSGMYYNWAAGLTRFTPELPVPVNEWSKVVVINNLKEILFKVNDKAGNPIPYPGTGFANTCSVLGGFDAGTEWFEGYLKSLRIRHTSE